MTPELETRLQSSHAPFDSFCIHNTNDLSLSQLRDLLAITIEQLESCYPAIQIFHDWHEHDGFIVGSKTDSWISMVEAIGTERALFDSRDPEFGVRIAIYPPSFDWLLRYNIDEEDESDYTSAACDFDFSVAENAGIDGLIDDLKARAPSVLTHCRSQPWFASNFGG